MDSIIYRKKAGLFLCLVLLAATLVLHLWPESAAREQAASRVLQKLGSRRLLEAALFLETGCTLQERPPAPGGQAARPVAATGEESISEAQDKPGPAEPPEQTAPPETEAQPQPPQIAPFTQQDADFISTRGNCSYQMDKTELLLAPLGWTLREGPKVLIIHSHSCEAYTQCEGHTYLPDANFRTLQKEESVIAVGDTLALELEKLGVEVVHDRSWNDYPSYNSSYASAREKIAQWLEQEPSIVMVLDLHRDALEKPVRETAALEGVTCAPLMLVVGTDQGGLNHPHWQRNLSCALKLQALANREQPDLFKALSFRKERFNGDMTPGSLIVEVGSTENTLPEAQASMPWLARYVAQLLALAAAEEQDPRG